MKKVLTASAFALVFAMLAAAPAEARIFEPEPNWWSSGRTCAASREPAGRRWSAMPPRSCRAAEAHAARTLRVSLKLKAGGPQRTHLAAASP